MLYNKYNIYIDIRYNAILRYLFRCPITNELVFEDVLNNTPSKYFYFDRDSIERRHYEYCNRFRCERYRECRLINQFKKLCSYDKKTFNYLLSCKKIIKYNKLNSILHLKEDVRKRIEKWLEAQK